MWHLFATYLPNWVRGVALHSHSQSWTLQSFSLQSVWLVLERPATAEARALKRRWSLSECGLDCRQNSKANIDEAFVCSPSWMLWRAAVVQRFHQHDRLLLAVEELIAVGPEQPSTSISQPYSRRCGVGGWVKHWDRGIPERAEEGREMWKTSDFFWHLRPITFKTKRAQAAVLVGNSGHQTDSHSLGEKL